MKNEDVFSLLNESITEILKKRTDVAPYYAITVVECDKDGDAVLTTITNVENFPEATEPSIEANEEVLKRYVEITIEKSETKH